MTQITTATNLQSPDISLPSSLSDTRKYFNNFYATGFDITSNANDAIVAFFEKYTGNKAAAANIASTVVYTALAQNIDPMAVLNDFQKLPRGELNRYLIAFLNSNRVPTSLLGIKDSIKTSPYVSRTILP